MENLFVGVMLQPLVQSILCPYRSGGFVQKHQFLQLELNTHLWLAQPDPEIDSMARKVAELLEVTGIDLEGKAAPYMLLLSIMGIFTALVVWKVLDILLNHLGVEFCAPREDEEVAQHHGHDIFTHS